MSCCCTSIKKLCEPASTCAGAVYDLPYTGLTTGAVYVFITDFLSSQIRIEVIADDDGNVQLPTDTLNENYEYTGKLIDQDSSVVTITEEEKTYDCISFTTKMIRNVIADI